MIIYLYPKCTTCQKALQFLKKNKLELTIKDISNEPPNIDELQKMLGYYDGNITKLLNTSGQLYREMELSKKVKDMPTSEILYLLSHHGMLVKRPFLLAHDFGLLGFKEEEWNKKLNHEPGRKQMI